jgi:ribonuclease J
LIDEVPAGRLFVDGNVIVEAEDDAIRIASGSPLRGRCNVAVAVSGKNAILAGPNGQCRAGSPWRTRRISNWRLEELERAGQAAFTKLNHAERGDDDLVEAAIMRAVRKAAERFWRKAPPCRRFGAASLSLRGMQRE